MYNIRICDFFVFSLGIQKVKEVFYSKRGPAVGQTPDAPEEFLKHRVDRHLEDRMEQRFLVPALKTYWESQLQVQEEVMCQPEKKIMKLPDEANVGWVG